MNGWKAGREEQAAETTAVAPRLGRGESGWAEEPGTRAKGPRRVLLHRQGLSIGCELGNKRALSPVVPAASFRASTWVSASLPDPSSRTQEPSASQPSKIKRSLTWYSTGSTAVCIRRELAAQLVREISWFTGGGASWQGRGCRPAN